VFCTHAYLERCTHKHSGSCLTVSLLASKHKFLIPIFHCKLWIPSIKWLCKLLFNATTQTHLLKECPALLQFRSVNENNSQPHATAKEMFISYFPNSIKNINHKQFRPFTNQFSDAKPKNNILPFGLALSIYHFGKRYPPNKQVRYFSWDLSRKIFVNTKPGPTFCGEPDFQPNGLDRNLQNAQDAKTADNRSHPLSSWISNIHPSSRFLSFFPTHNSYSGNE